ncbi:hypothetical protein S83_063229, partial [Arachis hypogaea]
VDIYESRTFIGGKVGSVVDKKGNQIEMGFLTNRSCPRRIHRCAVNSVDKDFKCSSWRPQEKFGGCYFQQGMEVKMEMKVEDAYRKSMETVLNWIQDTVNLNKSQVFFRTYAPVHF